MSGICLAAGTFMTVLTASAFSLSWTHSIEKTEWQEDYRLVDGRLRLEAARIKGSGAGMEPAEDAVWRDGWWEWHPSLTLDRLRLARSAVAGDYRLCGPDGCAPLAGILPPAAEGPVEIFPCPRE